MRLCPITHFLKLFILFDSWRTALCDTKYRIHDGNEFISFSNNVNSGTNYEGSTVLLDNDIDFTEELSVQFEPIGKNGVNYFRGTFDGQGYVIRNLAINSKNNFTGLFCFSTGTTIKNVVIDKTCSVVGNNVSSNFSCTGSIIGFCMSNKGACNIENSVNMADVTFNGNTKEDSYIGGVVGFFALTINEASIKDCMNYGSVNDIGTSESSSIGGIVGYSMGSISSTASYYVNVQNCLNYGSIIFNDITNQLDIGGISGYSDYGNLDNCVSFGSIVIPSSIKTKSVGCIVGYAYSSLFSHCYWDTSIDHGMYGYIASSSITDSYSFNSSSFELGGTVSIGNYTGTSIICALNGAADYYTLRGYSHWALNKDKRSIEFTINNTKRSFTMDSQIVLLPDLANEGRIVFDGWYRDSDCTVALDDYLIESDDETSLHGRWAENTNNYTISFDTRGGTSISSITGQFGTTVKINNPMNRKYCNFQSWETEYGDQVPTGDFTIPAQNITLYAVWLCTRITMAEDLVALSKAVNYYGINCKRSTVFLDNDIDFTEVLSIQFEPIGKNDVNYFRGSFDGQGHVIKNLTIKSTYQLAGLFGYSTGTTIKNVVIDGTCSVVSNYASTDSQAITGGLIGICISNEEPCNIEDSVNMADVTFNGNTKSLNIGCIAGAVVLLGYKSSVKNCVNYGAVKSIGMSESSVSIGGIVGSSQRIITSTSSSYVSVQNCLNYGTIIFNGTTNKIRIGGISGYSKYGNLDNCVNSGSIIATSSIEDKYVGNIVGYAEYSSFSHCYWPKDVGCGKTVGLLNESTSTNTYYVEQLNTTTLNELNEYADGKGLNKWFMLHLNGGRINNIAQSELVEFQSHIPVPVRESNTFLRWCKDAECNEAYDNDASGVTDLYAVWDTVYVTFLFENGTVVGPVGVKYGGKYGTLPETEVEGHTFCGWHTSEEGGIGGKVVTNETNVTTLNDHTLHGCWTKNKYTVTFDLGNGTVIEETYYYNDKINKPSSIEREGCIFYGWDNQAEFMPSQSITITALWNCTQSSSSSSSPSASSSSKKLIIEGKSKSSSNTGAIVGGVIGSIFFVAIIILVVLFLLFYKKREDNQGERSKRGIEMGRKRGGGRGRGRGREEQQFRVLARSRYSEQEQRSRVSNRQRGSEQRQDSRMMSRGEGSEEGTEVSADTARSYAGLYPEQYRIPTMSDALISVGLTQDQIKSVTEACILTGKSADREGKLVGNMTSGDAAAIAMYTYSFGDEDFACNPYRLINEALMGGENDREMLEEVSGLLFLVMSALRKLPRCTGRTLYRGMKEDINKSKYSKGSTVVWHGLSSTSPDMSAVKAFLGSESGGNGKLTGTLFIIEGGWGYDIQPYSLFPDEAEILLEPEREFRVQDMIEADMTVVKLEMVDTPVILPEVFGDAQP